MTERFAVGAAVQTPLGRGVVREVRGSGRVLVDVRGRAVLFDEHMLAIVDETASSRKNRRTAAASEPGSAREPSRTRVREVDLHGLTVDEALARCEDALNDALLADVEELRLIHGKGSGRIKAALHRRLREIPSVRAFRIHSRNEGVTIVDL